MIGKEFPDKVWTGCRAIFPDGRPFKGDFVFWRGGTRNFKAVRGNIRPESEFSLQVTGGAACESRTVGKNRGRWDYRRQGEQGRWI